MLRNAIIACATGKRMCHACSGSSAPRAYVWSASRYYQVRITKNQREGLCELFKLSFSRLAMALSSTLADRDGLSSPELMRARDIA